MKKHFFTIITLLSVILFSLSAGIFFCANSGAASVANASVDQNITMDAPKDLQELQAASDAQLDAWTKLNRFDGRNYGYVTSAKNQGGKLICWAYTAIGAVEANILRKGIDSSVTKDTLDLDEIAAAYVRHNRDGQQDPLFNTSNDTFEDEWNQGSHADDAFLAMTQGYSPVDQATSDMPTDNEIKKAISESKYFVRGFTRIDNDIDAIKRAILQYGSVTMEYKAPIYTSQKYLYYSDGHSLGHASLIVGWDDSIKSNLFTPDQPSSDGAWIVKNSWGPGGEYVNNTYCFYLSYESYLSNNLYTVDTSLKEDYPNLYYYDGQVVNNDTRFVTDAHGAIFEAKLTNAAEQEQLKAVVFGFKNKKLTANVKIYRHLTVNPGNVNDTFNNPTNGKLVAEKKNLYFENEGFYTVDLDEPIPLEQGEYFSIVISGVDTNNNPLYAVYGADSKSVNDMTYRLYNGEWTSVKTGGYYADSASYNMCARIRAVTNTVPRETLLENDMRYARVEIANRLLYYVKGQEQIPEITVYFGDKILQKDQDYTVKLFYNTTPGTATVEITGKNEYFGTRKTTFEVAKPKYPPGAINGTVTVYNNTTMLHQIPIPDDWEWIDSNFQLKTGLSDFNYSIRYVGYDADCYQIKTCGFKVNKIAQDPPYATDISNADVEIIGSYTYTGNSITPVVTVTYNSTQLRIGTDYTLTCKNNIDAGLASVTVAGKGLYKGEITKTFQILKADFPKPTPQSVIFVNQNARTLNDVELGCENWYWQDSGKIIGDETTAIAEYRGRDKNNYNNTEIEITVIKKAAKDISQISELRLEQTLFVYDGKLKTPKVVARDDDTALIDSVNFRVEYQNNQNAGTGLAIIIGINDYTGSKTLYFTIDKAERQNFSVFQRDWTFGDKDVPNPDVTGEEEPSVITYSYAAIEKEIFTAERPSNAGTYLVKATIEESQNYKSAESTAIFAISPKNIETCLLTVDSNNLYYTGKAVCPKISIQDGQKTLAEDVDFSVAYKDNINAGNASVTVTGTNNYTGSKTLYFTIDKAERQNFSVFQRDWTFGDKDVPNPDVTGEEEPSVITYSYAAIEKEIFTAERPSNAGTYLVKATIEESQNYKSAESTAIFAISPKNIETCLLTVDSNNLYYTGKAVCPKISIQDGQKTLAEDVDFSVAYKDNINAGNASVTVAGINNYTGTIAQTFEIQKATNINIDTVIHLNQKFRKLSDIKLPDGFEWDENSLVTVSKNVMTATAIYKGGNYDIERLVFEIIVDEQTDQNPNDPETTDPSDNPSKPPKTNSYVWLAVAIPSAAAVVATCVGLTIALIRRKNRRNKH